MSEEINHDRRRLLGTAAIGIAAVLPYEQLARFRCDNGSIHI
jgi:hypothetical protein